MVERYAITDGVRLAKLSIISLELGELEESQQLTRAARQRFEHAGTPDIAQAFLCDIAEFMIARRVGDHESLRPLAQAALTKMAAIGDGTQLERVTALIEIGDTYLDLAVGVDVVRSLLNEARDVLHTWPGSAPLLQERLTLAKTRLSKVSARVAEVSELTTAEIRVLQYLPSHFTMTRIAQELYISQSTVKTHCQSIYRKLRADNRTEAVATAIQSGLLPGHASLSPTR